MASDEKVALRNVSKIEYYFQIHMSQNSQESHRALPSKPIK